MEWIGLTQELLSRGYHTDELARLTRNGELDHVRRGAYAYPSTEELNDRRRHLRLIHATIRHFSRQAVVSHHSAAAVHRLPLWRDALDQVQLIRSTRGSGKVRRYVHLHRATLDEDEIRIVDDLRVTSLARTVVDLSRTLPLRRSVPIGDAALGAGLTGGEVTEALARAVGWPGIARARRAAGLLNPLSQSVGESFSRVVLVERGVPVPVLQRDVFNERGELVGCVDFCWEEQRTIGEFDGKIKYGRLLQPGQSVSDVVFAEKRREDALRDLGWQVVRWIWDDLRHPDELIDRLHRAFDRAAPAHGA